MTLSTRPIPPPTTASMGGSRIFPFIPGLRSSRATRTPPTVDLSGRSGAFSIAAGPRASDAGVHARTHSPVSFTTQAASAPLAHSTTISRTETRTRQMLPFMGMARILQPYVANAERRHRVRAAADLAQRRMRRYQGHPGLEGDARRTLPAPRGRRARPSPARGPDAPRRRRAGAPARPPAPRRDRGRLRGGRVRRLDHLPGRAALRARDRGAARTRPPLRRDTARCRPQRGRAARRAGRVRRALRTRLPHRDLPCRGNLPGAGLPLRAGGGGGIGNLRSRDGDARLSVLRPGRAPRARRRSGAALARAARPAGPRALPGVARVDRPHRPRRRGAGHRGSAARRAGRPRVRPRAPSRGSADATAPLHALWW